MSHYDPPPPTQTHPVIGGRYQVGELLGRGGMAEVRKGADTRLGRTVAIKRLRTDLASDSTFRARFHREAQSSASLNHPSIGAVYDTGEEMMPDGATQPYIVMELIDGRTLRDVLREGRKILPQRALEITSDVLAALDYSHRAGIIHRDIKPGNVMLTQSGDVKVIDFGIARAISDSAASMTQTSAVVGTAQYLSPEQARGETIDSRSDVYSAGCLLYELLTGRPPFVGDSPVSVASQHVLEHAQPPSVHDPSLPREIDGIVMKALAKRVENRYQSASAMRSDIERYLAGHPVAPHVPEDTDPRTQVTPVGAVAGSGHRADDERGPKPWLLILLGVIVLALVATGAFFLPQLFDNEPDDTIVPDVVGMNVNEARQTLGNEGLEPKVVRENDDEVPPNEVFEQDPVGDDTVDPGSVVTITVSIGPENIAIPDVTNSPIKSVRDRLTSAPFNFEVVVEKVPSDEAKGTVLASDPAAGTKVAPGTEIILDVAKGPRKVPDVVGLTEEEAAEKIENRGFVPQFVDDPASVEDYGTVVSQTPGEGSEQRQGETVVVFVSRYGASLPPCPTTTPPTDPGDPPTCAASDETTDETTTPGDELSDLFNQ